MILFDSTQMAIEATVRGTQKRTEALQHNLANINTPGFRRVDVPFHQRLKEAMASEKAGERGALSRVDFSAQADGQSAVRGDGNSVDLDQEQALLAQTALEHSAAVSLLAMRKRTLEATMRFNG